MYKSDRTWSGKIHNPADEEYYDDPLGKYYRKGIDLVMKMKKPMWDRPTGVNRSEFNLYPR